MFNNVVNLTEHPNNKNTVMDPKQIVTKPLFAQLSTVSNMYDISYGTARKLLNEAEEEGIEGLYIEMSSRLTLVNLDKFTQFLYRKHKSYL